MAAISLLTGWNWRALPSPQMVPPTVHWAEVGAVEYVSFRGKPGGRFYAMLGGNHNEKADMITYSADKPQGPFTAATKNCKYNGDAFSICRVVRLANPEVSLLQGGARASSRSS